MLICFVTFFVLPAEAIEDFLLWYDKPAQRWEEALPIGNGRLGAAISGCVEQDTIRLSIQNIVADTTQACHGMTCGSIGRMLLSLGHYEYSNYKRWLDLSSATAGVSYESEGITYERTYFTSFVDKVLFIRLTARKGNKILNPLKNKNLLRPTMKFTSPERNDSITVTIEKNGDPSMIVAKSTLAKPAMENVPDKQECSYTLVRSIEDDKGITIVVSCGTNFKCRGSEGADAMAEAAYYMNAFCKKVNTFNYGQYRTTYYAKALYDHTSKYKKQFDRVTLDLGCDSLQTSKDTETRIKEFAATYDPSLVTLYFQFGRYLLISSSQSASQPANLQGTSRYDGRRYPAWDPKFWGASPDIYCTGITEKLLQSHDGIIHILPALPDEWAKEGCITGVSACGGFEIVKLQWKDGRINHLVIRSTLGGNLRIRSAEPLLTVTRTKIPVPYHPARHTTKIDLTPLVVAKGANPNPLMQQYEIPAPHIVDETKIPALHLKPTQVYDIMTVADQQIELVTPYSKF